MAKSFHENEFNDATQVKLSIFRGYIREWIPVFLTEWKKRNKYRLINIFDLFAGPGTDAKGNPGSPRIIQEELRSFCETQADLKATGLSIKLYFNDKINKHIEQLKDCLAENACPQKCCQPIFSSKPFQEVFDEYLPIMQSSRSANLVIMDQFGVSEVTPNIVQTLAGCSTTDILFFISSSYIHRFADVPAIQKYFKMSAAELAASEYKSIHRHICSYFQSSFQSGIHYHLAPFSIRKGSNIYGVIFGSSSLFGLQKFLKVCWKLDGKTGEANYDIDNDPVRYGQLSFLPEMNVIKKQDEFEQDLKEMLYEKSKAGRNPILANNLDVYRFTLEKGFLPKHANDILKKLQASGSLEVIDANTGEAVRRGWFYVNWDNYKDSILKVVYRQKD
jgi:three-Cys-motif partner protein